MLPAVCMVIHTTMHSVDFYTYTGTCTYAIKLLFVMLLALFKRTHNSMHYVERCITLHSRRGGNGRYTHIGYAPWERQLNSNNICYDKQLLK